MNQRIGDLSGFLYASPSFVEGAARIFDFGDAMSANAYNHSSSSLAADERAISADWMAVGEDISKSIERMRREIAAIKNAPKT